MAEEVTWISAWAAVELLAEQVGGVPTAKELIADALRDGRVVARAKAQWRGSSPVFNGPQGRQAIALGRDITREEWQSSANWPADVARWNWMDSKFFVSREGFRAVSYGGMGPRYTLFDGVEFSREEITALFRPKPAGRTKRRGGVSPNLEIWDTLYREILMIAQVRKLNFTRYPTIVSLRADLFQRTGLSEDTIEARVSEIWNDFIGPDKRY